MTGKRLSAVIAGALSLSALALSGCASDNRVGAARGGAPDALLDGPLDPPASFPPHAYSDVYDLARAGDCAAVDERLSLAEATAPADERATRLGLIGLLYDTGLCRPFDPQRAYEAFAAARDEEGRAVYLSVAWKEWYGHGVARDRERSYERTRDWVLYALSVLHFPVPAFAEELVLFRPAHPPLAEGALWAERLRTGPPDRLSAFAIALIAGRATDWNGKPIPRTESSGRSLLTSLALEYPRAHLDFAKAALDGRLSHMTSISKLDVLIALRIAARACVGEAFTTLIAFHQQENRWWSPHDAYRWALRAERAGFLDAQRRQALGEALSASKKDHLKAYVEAEPHYDCRRRQ